MCQLAGQAGHSLALSVRNHIQNNGLFRTHIRSVHTVEPATLQLNDFVFTKGFQGGVSDRFCGRQRRRIDKIFEFVLLFQFLLGHQMIKFGQNNSWIACRYVGHPRKLAFGRFEISIRNEISLETSFDLRNFHDAPSQQNNLLPYDNALRINLFKQNILSDANDTISQSWVLGMVGRSQIGIVLDTGSIRYRQRHVFLVVNRHESFRSLVDLLFIFGPELIPLHIHDTTRRALRVDEGPQGLNVDTPTNDTSHGREARVVPPGHQSLLDEPSQFAFRQDRVHKVDTRKGVDANASQLERLQNPLVLFVTIVVFGGT
mmetsp:Transcript_12480/g.19705  ORF Transcript_12480/g.19705 Transcript_12480/m.19705 type:complete len:316 (+) Transcript_12480:858-1805(+)